MLLNQILFWMMIVEAVVCLIISLPFGKRISQAVVQFLAAHLKDTKAAFVAKIVLALVSILFISDVNTVYKHHSSESVLSDGLRIRLLVAQRDMYITGFVLFLFLLLGLVYTSMETNIYLEKNLSALKKQAEGAATGFKQQLEENESIRKQLAKLHLMLDGDDAGGDDDSDTTKRSESMTKKDVLAKLMEENLQLTAQLETTTKELEAAESKIEVVKKQAEGQSSAFMKLMDEKNEADKHVHVVKEQEQTIAHQTQEIKDLKAECHSLRSQIQDYDFMFAEAKKKAE